MTHDVEVAGIANATTEPDEHDTKITITPEMVAAGAREFLACRSMMTETAEEAAADIFRAMVLASREPSRRAS